MSFDDKQFKQIMARWATGIAVVTTAHEGEMRGFTVNSFASVSIDPLLISMSAAKTLYTLGQLLEHGAFAVNILAYGQEELGGLFAGFKDVEDRFSGIEVSLSPLGNPLLGGILGWMDCRVYKTVDVGASTLILGEVVAGDFREDLQPLTYFNRQWGGFVAKD